MFRGRDRTAFDRGYPLSGEQQRFAMARKFLDLRGRDYRTEQEPLDFVAFEQAQMVCVLPGSTPSTITRIFMEWASKKIVDTMLRSSELLIMLMMNAWSLLRVPTGNLALWLSEE